MSSKKKARFAFPRHGFAHTKSEKAEKHLVCSAGGIRAVLGIMGSIFGLHSQGKAKWASIGGISGGSIIAALFAAGHHPRKLLRLALTIDFESLLLKKHSMVTVVRKYLMQAKNQPMPLTATMCSEQLGLLVDKLVPIWPDPLWIMAVANVDGDVCQVLFTKAGTFLYRRDGSYKHLSTETPSVGTAVRASIAIPGAIGHVSFLGLDLYDGVLSWDGRCPVGVAHRHHGAPYKDIVGCDVGDYSHPIGILHDRFLNLWVGDDPKKRTKLHEWEAKGVKLVKANITNFSSLHLKPTKSQRHTAIRNGFHAAHETFKKKKVRKNKTIATGGKKK